MADDKPLPLTSENPNHKEYVGIISSSWSWLEYTVDTTSWYVAGLDQELGSCFSANIRSLNLKLMSLHALLELRGASDELLKSVRKYRNGIHSTAEKRNRVIHDPWLANIVSEEIEMSQFVSLANSKGRKFGPVAVPIDTLKELNLELNKQTDAFFELSNLIAEEFPPQTEKEPPTIP